MRYQRCSASHSLQQPQCMHSVSGLQKLSTFPSGHTGRQLSGYIGPSGPQNSALSLRCVILAFDIAASPFYTLNGSHTAIKTWQPQVPFDYLIYGSDWTIGNLRDFLCVYTFSGIQCRDKTQWWGYDPVTRQAHCFPRGSEFGSQYPYEVLMTPIA